MSVSHLSDHYSFCEKLGFYKLGKNLRYDALAITYFVNRLTTL